LGVTVNAAPLLATPATVTTTGPLVAPVGTGTLMLVALQLLGVAEVPLNVTVLLPGVDPKFVPAIVTLVPTTADDGVRLVMVGGGTVTVNAAPLLATPPTVTTTCPLVAPVGTGTLMLVALQLLGAAEVPLNVTVLVPRVVPKFVPEIVTLVPTTPDDGVRLVMVGGGGVTVKLTPALATPPTVTMTGPVVAAAGTGTVMFVVFQVPGIAAAPLNVTVLPVEVAPKFDPAILTLVPTAPDEGVRLVIVGMACVPTVLRVA
jgi:hypothetical protein